MGVDEPDHEEISSQVGGGAENTLKPRDENSLPIPNNYFGGPQIYEYFGEILPKQIPVSRGDVRWNITDHKEGHSFHIIFSTNITPEERSAIREETARRIAIDVQGRK